MRFPASDVKNRGWSILKEEGARLMTLLGYIDSLADMSYYDEDPESLEYVERWEAQQPKTAEGKRQKNVNSPLQITLATREECREGIKDELPDVYASADIHRENAVHADQDLEEMVARHQKSPAPTKYPHDAVSQRYLYEAWCRKLLAKERIPNYDDFGEWTRGWLLFLFGMKDSDELAMVFGFGDLLPEKRRDPVRAAGLMYRGFQYSCDQKFVIENRDVVLAEFKERASQREAAKAERLAQRCAYQVVSATQITVDKVVNQTQNKMYDEERVAYWALVAKQRREEEAELARARQAQQAKIDRGRQEAEAARKARAAETARQKQASEAHKQTGASTQGQHASSTSGRSRTTYVKTEFHTSGRSTIFSSLGTVIDNFVTGVINIANEIFDGVYPGGEPK